MKEYPNIGIFQHPDVLNLDLLSICPFFDLIWERQQQRVIIEVGWFFVICCGNSNSWNFCESADNHARHAMMSCSCSLSTWTQIFRHFSWFYAGLVPKKTEFHGRWRRQYWCAFLIFGAETPPACDGPVRLHNNSDISWRPALPDMAFCKAFLAILT